MHLTTDLKYKYNTRCYRYVCVGFLAILLIMGLKQVSVVTVSRSRAGSWQGISAVAQSLTASHHTAGAKGANLLLRNLTFREQSQKHFSLGGENILK